MHNARMPENLFELPQLIDKKLWMEAQLGGVAFLIPKDKPPGLGLIFPGGPAGLAIFDGWRRDLGEVDRDELLRVSIVEGEIPGKPPGYTLLLSVDLQAVVSRAADGVSVDMNALGVVKRRMNTPPGGSPHLANWKPLYAATGEFALVPLINGPDGWEPRYERMLRKKRLHLRRAEEIKAGDPDASALD